MWSNKCMQKISDMLCHVCHCHLHMHKTFHTNACSFSASTCSIVDPEELFQFARTTGYQKFSAFAIPLAILLLSTWRGFWLKIQLLEVYVVCCSQLNVTVTCICIKYFIQMLVRSPLPPSQYDSRWWHTSTGTSGNERGWCFIILHASWWGCFKRTHQESREDQCLSAFLRHTSTDTLICVS